MEGCWQFFLRHGVCTLTNYKQYKKTRKQF